MRVPKAGTVFAFTVFVSLHAVAQDAVRREEHIPSIKVTKVRAARVNTNRFFPQIDDAPRPFFQRVENEFRPPWRNFSTEPNTLPVGQMQDYERIGGREALFPAISFTGWVPPDPDLAVGPNNIVGVVNVDLAFFTKTGTKTFQQSLGTFFAPVGAGSSDLFDPKCFYDRIHNRFVVVCLEQRSSPRVSKFLFAVSDDNDPAGTWFMYRFEAMLNIAGNDYWVDYPGCGYNKDAYVLTGNLFPFAAGGFAGVEFVAIQKPAVLSGQTATTSYFRDGNAFGVQVAEMLSPTEPRLVTASDFNSSTLRLHAFTNLTSAPPTLTPANMTVPTFSYPTINAPSPGGRTLDVLDGRLINAVWRGGKLYTTHGVGNGSGNWIRWYEINTNTWPTSGPPTLSQAGDVVGPTGVHFFMPAIGVNEFFDASIIFTRSSSSIIADLMAVGRKATDAPGTMGAPLLLESSLPSTYGSAGFNRWGDYFGVESDPFDDTTFWGIGMTGAGSGAWWRTSIFSWTITTPVVLSTVSASPNPVVGGNPSTGTVTLSGSAPPGGYTVALSSSDPAIASVPTSVTVPQGASSANFVITTAAVGSDATVTIGASFRGINRNTNLTVQANSTVVNPSSFTVIGDLVSGNLNSLMAQDGDRLVLRVSTTADIHPPIWLRLTGTSPIQNPSKIEFTIVSRAIPTLKLQRILLFDYVAAQFVVADSRLITNTDGTVSVTITTNPSRFVQPVTRQMRATIDWQDTLGDTLLLWRTETDRTFWRIFP